MELQNRNVRPNIGYPVEPRNLCNNCLSSATQINQKDDRLVLGNSDNIELMWKHGIVNHYSNLSIESLKAAFSQVLSQNKITRHITSGSALNLDPKMIHRRKTLFRVGAARKTEKQAQGRNNHDIWKNILFSYG